MKPPRFEYLAPEGLDEAVAALAEYGDEARVLAGGQSLMPMLAFRLAAPALLIDLNRVRAMDYIRHDGNRLLIGAMTRQRTVERLPSLQRRCAVLAEGVGLIGHMAIRNRGTVGGSMAHADSAAEWPALALVLNGECEVAGPLGRRVVPADEFFVGYLTTSLEPDELLTEVRVDLPVGRVGSSFVEIARRHGDFAVAGVAALLALADDGSVTRARLALIGVAERVVRARQAEVLLEAEKPDGELLAEAATAVDQAISPRSDLNGSAAYRRHVAKVLTKRAILTAWRRAQQGEGVAGAQA